MAKKENSIVIRIMKKGNGVLQRKFENLSAEEIEWFSIIQFEKGRKPVDVFVWDTKVI